LNTRLLALAVVFCAVSSASAGTTAIGTASVRGDMRVDGYRISGDATLFDGTVVQTGQASADLRLTKGVEIKLATDSRGTLYRDHIVLQQGSSEWTPSSSFSLEANGLSVTPSEPNSKGLVSLGGANTVEVAALTGGFQVRNDNGLLLARVSPGHAMSFGAIQSGTPESNSNSITVTGAVSFQGGYYFLSVAETGVVYELTGKDFSKEFGATVTVTGTIDPNAKPAYGAVAVIDVSKKKKKGGSVFENKALLGALILGGAAGIGVGVYEVNQPSTPASR
jgi:hypothetical protein